MKDLLVVTAAFVLLSIACGGSARKEAEWTKGRAIAGKGQGLSHVSGIVIDENAAFVTIGGTVADSNAGMSGLRKIALDTGAVSNLENGEKMPQSENGGIVSDEKYVYWNGGSNILRIAKEGGKPEVVTSENIGIGIDMAVDAERIYWANHSYYSSNSPNIPKPIYSVAKRGGKTDIFANEQNVPANITIDDTWVYWTSPSSILKQAKSGGTPQVVFQATEKEGIDLLRLNGDDLYFGFRGAGDSHWALRKISKNGGEPITLIKSFSLKPFVIDDKNIFFFNEAGINDDVLCKVPRSGGEIVTIDSGYASGVIAQRAGHVFVGSLDTIFSFDK